MSNGIFGLKHELAVLDSGVRGVFTPHQPVDLLEHLFGRETEVTKLVSYINTPGQHALLYGDRGVGKSSLATATSKYILKNLIRGKLYEKRCCSADDFTSVFEKPLKDAGINIDLVEYSSSHTEGGGAKIGLLGSGADIKSQRGKNQKYVPKHRLDSPSWVAEKISKLNGLLVIDEADAIKNTKDKNKIAETIKLLSDMGSEFKILIVGIAKTGGELTAGHPSVERCLKETHLPRMSPEALKKIILSGAQKLKLIFEDEVIDNIVEISAGYPHFTHLICLKCAENAISKKNKHVNVGNLQEALVLAVDESEGVLRRMYQCSVPQTDKEAEYRNILLAAAKCKIPDFNSNELRSKLSELLGIKVSQRSISFHISKLVSDKEDTILRRVSKGVYQFRDPRMPSFIKMLPR